MSRTILARDSERPGLDLNYTTVVAGTMDGHTVERQASFDTGVMGE